MRAPSATSLAHARRILSDVKRNEAGDAQADAQADAPDPSMEARDRTPTDLGMILSRPTSNVIHVTTESVTCGADHEYLCWRTPHPKIQFTSDFDLKLHEWLRSLDEVELARLLDEAPVGLSADPDSGASVAFTPWQRLSLVHWVRPAFDICASVHIALDDLRVLGRYRPQERCAVRDMTCTYSVRKGAMSDATIVDLSTGSGKTAWACCAGYMALTRYKELVREYEQKQCGTVMPGSPRCDVARLVVIAAPPTTFDHFVTTLRRLLPMLPGDGARVRLWTTMSKHFSVRDCVPVDGVRDEEILTFWVVPVAKLKDVLRKDPDVAIPVCITDEFTVDTPVQRLTTIVSPVLKQIVTQATPQALVQATQGARTWLKVALDGALIDPSRISTLLAERQLSKAALGLRQMVTLHLMSLTPFRKYVRKDLQSLTPTGIDVHFVRSRIVTLSAHLARTQADLVPANLYNVLANAIRHFHPNAQSLQALRDCVSEDSPTPDAIVAVLRGMESERPPERVDRTALDRVVERVREFSVQCPLCWDAPESNMRVFGCCGYCVCEDCFQRGGGETALSRCAFCRSTVPRRVPRVDVAPPLERQASLGDVEPSFGLTLTTSLRRRTSVERVQSANLVQVLHCLKHHGRKRILLLLECPRFFMSDREVFDAQMVAEETGVVITRIDTMLGGKATQFAKVMRERFNTSDPQPMALLSLGMHSSLLTGTDLAYADALVSVGEIDTSHLTQAVGRILRPRASRDNTQPMVMIKIYAR